jgi:hypothetical protein
MPGSVLLIAARPSWKLWRGCQLAAGHPHGLPHTAVAHDLAVAIEGVHARLPIYSARINNDWRAMGVLKDGALIWFWVGSHKTYEALLLKGRLG